MKNFLPRVLNVLFCLCLCLPFPCCATTADVTTQKAVYLTFDDGPTDSTTPKVLSVLKEKGVCATFFVVGRQISTRKEILKSIAESGNAIGIHTQTHDYRSIYASAESLEKDILECKKIHRRSSARLRGQDLSFSGRLLHRFRSIEKGARKMRAKVFRLERGNGRRISAHRRARHTVPRRGRNGLR